MINEFKKRVFPAHEATWYRYDIISVILHEEVCWLYCKTRQDRLTMFCIQHRCSGRSLAWCITLCYTKLVTYFGVASSIKKDGGRCGKV